ncbi:hypothetical protein G7054_g13615 [Neopestalotiopsis clavispora]|nr:hypothetical protein G7054_g13615 [Neopestalotiopsis clavispora]
MSLRRTGTRKAPGGASKGPKGYDIVQQGLQVVYPDENDSKKSDIDVVFVPGLGAHPSDSWSSTTTKWNWMESEDGICATFPKARILLYMYESAWQGQLKVNQFMDNISKTLLVALRAKREKCKQRPIVFIGHSMGGLVIAKAITILNAQPELCPVMFEAISAAVFFGTPFAGAPAAAWASMYAYWAEKSNKATTSEVLDMLKPGDGALRELKDEFRRVAAKTRYKIELLCFWEEQHTDFAKMAHLPGLFGLTRRMIPKDVSEFVSQASATFEGDVDKYGLASNHRDLVKFDSAKDSRWNIVENLLKKTIHGAYSTARNRLGAARDIDWTTFMSVMDALDSARLQPARVRKGLLKNVGKSSLISNEPDYTQWLANIEIETDATEAVKVDGLWVRGPEGRGKTGAMLAALDDVESLIDKQENEAPVLFAYFLCDAGTDYCTAEDCIKSIIWQLIEKEKALATHAKDFVKEKGKNGVPKSRATPTVENLWKALQGMLADEFAGSGVYIVLSNLHLLPEDSDSTLKFLKLLSAELEGGQMVEPNRVMAKWLITGRPTYAIQNALGLDRLRVIDLEDQKFGNQYAKTLRTHARSKVDQLQVDKKYNQALAWFARSLIGERAQNTSWIDITCLQLEELPEDESDVRVRRMLEDTPKELHALLKNAWLQIFRSTGEEGENVREMLRALVLTVEEPTAAELAVLCGQNGSEHHEQEIKELIDKCKPLISIKRKVGFMNSTVKQHLIENCEALLGLSAQETSRQHGLLSLRSLAYLKDRFHFPETELPSSEDPNEDDEGSEADTATNVDSDNGDDSDAESTSDTGSDNDSDEEGYDNEWDDDKSEPDLDPEAQILEDLAVLPYMVKNWLEHGSKATIGFADDLSLDEEFWEAGSLLRRRWMVEYNRHTNEFDYIDIRGMNALHVVASLGFRQLLAALMENGHKEELDGRDERHNTPLCLASYFGHADMVEELLDNGAEINEGESESEDTPLHLAAEEGHVAVMKKLIARGASLNAFSEDSGLVLNSAISSGNLATIELLVNHGVKLSTERDDTETPLAQAASLSDVSMLEYLMKEYSDQLAPEEYSKALIAAAGAGNIEVLSKLLPFEHSDNDYQSALDEAATEGNWEVTKLLLEKRSNLSCDKAFYEAATRTDDLMVLEALWEYTNGNISADTVDRSLYQVTDDKKIDKVRLLLDRFGADANAQGDQYGNALTASAYDGTLDILKVLLDHGAKADSAEGWALQTAATEGHVDIVKELLSRGAKVDAKTENPNFQQQTALQGACEFGRDEIVDILLEHGANPNLGGGEDDYPIIAAAKYCQIDIIGKLISANADVNVVGGEDGDTALIMTAKRIANIEPLEQLLKAGAKIDATNNNGDTALIAAAAEGDNEFVNFLLAKGADVMHTNNDDMNALQAASDNDLSKETWNVLIKHISTILSGLKKRMEDGDHGVISAVGEARAVAQADNIRDCSLEEGSDRGSIMTDVTKNDHRKSFGYEQDDFKTTEKSMTHAKVADPRLSIDQSSLQYVAGPMDELRHEIDAATIFHQDDAFKRSDIHPGNMFAHQYFDDTNLPLRNNADPFTTHDPTQRAEAWQQQVDVPYDNHHLPRWSNDGQNVNISQNLDGLPQRNSMGPLRRKPAPVLHGTRNYSQGSVYSERPSSQEGVTPHQQPSSYIPYNPSNFAPTVHSSSQSPPRLPPLSSPPSYSSQPDTQSHYQSGYHGAMGASMQANQVPSGSDRYAAKPPLIQAYSSPAQIPPPLPQRVGPNTNYTTPPLRQDARPNYFGVKDTFNQAKDRLFSPYRGDDSGR